MPLYWMQVSGNADLLGMKQARALFVLPRCCRRYVDASRDGCGGFDGNYSDVETITDVLRGDGRAY
jgi:hypothetical protein